MKLTFLDNITERLTARPTSQRNEVLFFATAHFLFFNFYATAQNTLSFFLPTHKPNIKKMKECFFSSLQLRMKNLHLLNNQILPLNF